MVYAVCVLLIEVVLIQAFDAFVFPKKFSTFLKIVNTCAEGAGFHPFAFASSMVASRAFIAPALYHVILYFADLLAEFNSSVQQQFSSLCAHFNYQIPSVFLCFVTVM